MQNWTDKEISYLKSRYGRIANKNLAIEMGRSKQAIQHMAHRLGITDKKVATYKYCVDCGVKLSRASCYKTSAKRCFSCAMKAHSGSGHHNWKGGVAPLRSMVHVLLKPMWIDPILKRDRYTCQFCKKRGGDMNVHHIYPYRKIRDKVIKDNPGISTRTFEGKKQLALKIVAEHQLSYGITLCVPCHAKIHNETRGELLGNLTASGEGNQQPSRSNVVLFVDRKVHRLTGEDTQTNKPDTSAPHLLSMGDDIVGTYGKP